MILNDRKNYSMTVDCMDADSASGLNREDMLLDYSNLELLHAVLTTTFPSARLTASYRDKSRLELINRFVIVENALNAKGDQLSRSENAMYLVDAERSSISYYIGLIYTKLIAEKLLDTSCLVSINRIPVNGKSLPFRYGGLYRYDMIGYNMKKRAMNVMESVGRTENSMAAFTDACRSSAELRKINGEKPESANVVMTYFEKGYLTAALADASKLLDILEARQGQPLPAEEEESDADQYEFIVDDSDQQLIAVPGRTEKPATSKAAKKRRAGVSIAFSEKDYFNAYYRPVFELLTSDHPEYLWDETRAYYETELEIPHFGRNNEVTRKIIIGMGPQLFSCIRKGEYDKVAQAAAASHAYKRSGRQFCGSDGIWVRVK